MHSKSEDEFIVHYKVENFFSAIEILENPHWEDDPVFVHNDYIIRCSNEKAQNFRLCVPLKYSTALEIKSLLSKICNSQVKMFNQSR
jgi:hypothetical protein